jgi:eukaryotic-like serine/threonine-protein kinase
VTDTGERMVLNDRYEIHKRIGRGGMADVFLARDLLLDRLVAIKVLFPEFATDPNFVERFRREAQAAANLTHPNIVAVYDWGKYTNTYFMAMEYVQGRTLADILRANGHINSVQAAEIANEVAAALGSAHASGVVHRDIKPANILIGAGGQVKVADFGIARAMNAAVEHNLTQVGSVMGTATYFSPEQAQGGQPDPRSDLYSLGIVLYEMVAGKPPFTGENPVSIAYKQVHDLPQPLNQIVADVPRPFEAIVAKLLAKDPNRRYTNADALRDDLRRYRSGEQVMALASVAGSPQSLPPRTNDTGSASNATQTMTRTTSNPAQDSTQVMGRTTTMPVLPKRRRPVNWYGIASFVALIVLAVGAVALFTALRKPDKPASATTVGVPQLIGTQLEDAQKTLTAAGLTFEAIAEPTVGQAENVVVRTDPVFGADIAKAGTVKLYFNPPISAVPVPEVKGKSVEEATKILTTAGFTVAKEVVYVENQLSPGQVISTNPAANAPTKPGTAVVLTVSKAPDQVSVPNVAGQSSAAATSLLQGEPYAFQVTVQTESSAEVGADAVIRTDPAGDTPVPKGSAVTLVVSAGPAKVRVPPVEGQTEAAARNQLVTVGLVANVVYVPVATGSAEDGHVISQSIQPTEKVAPNTSIRLQVGKAAPPPATTTTTTTPPPTSPPATTTTVASTTTTAVVTTTTV